MRHYFSAAVILCLACIPASTILMVQSEIAPRPGVFGDFSAYWMAVERWQHGVSIYGNQTYGVTESLGLPHFFPYLYPPAGVLLFYLYQFVGYTIAATLWGITTSGVLWLSIVILLEEYIEMTWVRRTLLIPLVFFFQPVWYAFTLGQITPMLAGFVGFSAVAMERTYDEGKQGLVGVGATVAAFIKPTAAPAGAVLLPSWRRVAGAVLTAASLYIIGIAVFGLNSHVEYFHVLLTAKTEASTSLRPISEYHSGWFEPFDILGFWAWVPRIFLLAIVAILSFLRNNSLAGDRAAFAAGAAVIPLAMPEGYSLSFVFYIPAAIVLSAERHRWAPVLGLTLIASHWHAWTLHELSEQGLATEIAVVSQLGLYAGLVILGLAVHILWKNLRPKEEFTNPAKPSS